MIGDRDVRLEEAREHLAPTGIWLLRLVAHGRIAQQKNRGHLDLRDLDGTDGGPGVAELQRQPVVPGPRLLRRLARRFEPDLARLDVADGSDLGSARVDDERDLLEPARRACGPPGP